MMSIFNEKLEQIKNDPDQFAAFNSNTSTVVKAGPGSGKTTVLTLKIMQLLTEKIKAPRGLACITYSNEAAKEFKTRLKDYGFQKRENVILDTVHSFCISEVIIPFSSIYEEGISLPLDIISSNEKQALFSKVRDDLGISPQQVNLVNMDKERNQSIGVNSSVEMQSYDLALQVAREYELRLKELGKVDFIEVVKCATNLIKNYEYVRKCLESKFPWILIDEYQDLGKPLHEMVLTLYSTTKIKIFAVGDPDQSIYSFQGAIPNYLLELFENRGFSSIQLKTNYRSNQDIVDASSVALNIDDREYRAGTRLGERAEFHFVSCDNNLSDQFDYVINNIIPECIESGIPFQEICVLMKSGEDIKSLSRKMENMDIPFCVAKHDIMKSKILLWLRDCARWKMDQSALSFTELADFWLKILTSSGITLTEEIKMAEKKLLFNLLRYRIQTNRSLNEWLNSIFTSLELLKLINHSDRYKNEFEIVQNFLSNSKLFFNNDIEKFAEVGVPQNQVTLSTRHSSKGLEFEVVIMLGMEEGNFPDYRTVNDAEKLNEQRRLFFVCISRAKRVCYLLMSKSITSNTRFGERTHPKQPSVFWRELYEFNSSLKE
ncbi:ATP-dependent helicase [Bacillus sp. Cs-700]|uniref:ATP-dependent helicase n=1 Tax=Bacillus sp. Cs-700 TaxID=2589818 RepID=UPI001F62409A|nr:ATP-dependent helicase [Bacillus sp. Cs-700]